MKISKLFEELEQESSAEYKVVSKNIDFLPVVMYESEVCKNIGALMVGKKAYAFAITNLRILLFAKSMIGVSEFHEFKIVGIKNIAKSETSLKFDYFEDTILFDGLTALALSKLENGIKQYYKEKDNITLDPKLEAKIMEFVEDVINDLLNEKITVIDGYLGSQKEVIDNLVEKRVKSGVMNYLDKAGLTDAYADLTEYTPPESVEEDFNESEDGTEIMDSEKDITDSEPATDNEEDSQEEDSDNILVEGLEYREEFDDENFKPEDDSVDTTKSEEISKEVVTEEAVLPEKEVQSNYHYKKSNKLVKDYTVLSIITTGNSPIRNKIIQISAIKYRNYKPIDKVSYMINPERKLNSNFKSQTGISDKDLKDKPLISEVIQEIIDFIGIDIVVTYDSDFTSSFFIENIKKLDLEPSLYTIVDIKYFKNKFGADNLSFDKLKEIVNIENSNSYDSEDSAEAISSIYKYIKYKK